MSLKSAVPFCAGVLPPDGKRLYRQRRRLARSDAAVRPARKRRGSQNARAACSGPGRARQADWNIGRRGARFAHACPFRFGFVRFVRCVPRGRLCAGRGRHHRDHRQQPCRPEPTDTDSARRQDHPARPGRLSGGRQNAAGSCRRDTDRLRKNAQQRYRHGHRPRDPFAQGGHHGGRARVEQLRPQAGLAADGPDRRSGRPASQTQPRQRAHPAKPPAYPRQHRQGQRQPGRLGPRTRCWNRATS